MNTCRFSPDRTYRYTLTHRWDRSLPYLVVIGLNPSTADEQKLDPTLRKVKGFGERWGMGGFVMLNLFAYRATLPADMKRAPDPIGPRNDHWLTRVCSSRKRGPVLVAWGTHGGFKMRDTYVLRRLTGLGIDPLALRVTQGGFPEHPLYVPYDVEPGAYLGRPR